VPENIVVLQYFIEWFKVKFVKRKEAGSDVFKWPEKEDIDTVSKDRITTNVTEPQTDRRGLLSFANAQICNYNIS